MKTKLPRWLVRGLQLCVVGMVMGGVAFMLGGKLHDNAYIDLDALSKRHSAMSSEAYVAAYDAIRERARNSYLVRAVGAVTGWGSAAGIPLLGLALLFHRIALPPIKRRSATLQLKQLQDMLANSIITQDEFDAKANELKHHFL